MGHAGRPSVHAQTQAVYRLLDELRKAHPGVEIESCSSGGARVDLGILERTDRIWASDCNDALERQTIQRWTGVVVPPELVGSHIGPTTSHTTARTHDLSFRAITAMFGHFGLEWDVRRLDDAERTELARAIALFKQYRPLLHSGRMVRADEPDPALRLHGVVSHDGGEALYALVSVATSFAEVPGTVGLPGLLPDTAYRVEAVYPAAEDRRAFLQAAPPAWLAGRRRGVGTLPGRIRAPNAGPEPGTRPAPGSPPYHRRRSGRRSSRKQRTPREEPLAWARLRNAPTSSPTAGTSSTSMMPIPSCRRTGARISASRRSGRPRPPCARTS